MDVNNIPESFKFKKIEEFMKLILREVKKEFDKQFYAKFLTYHIYKPEIKSQKTLKVSIDTKKELLEKENVHYHPKKEVTVDLKHYFTHFESDWSQIDKMLQYSFDNFVMPFNIKRVVQQIVSSMNRKIYEQYKNIFQSFKLSKESPFKKDWFSYLGKLHQLLNKQGAFLEDRFLFLSTELNADLINNFPIYQSEYFLKTCNLECRNKNTPNFLGHLLGFDHYYDLDLPYHESGFLGDSGLAEIEKDLSLGSNELYLKSLHEKCSLKKGDLFYFGQDPKQKNYVVTSNVNADQNGRMKVEFNPSLQEKIDKNSFLILEASHFVNLAFQREAFVTVSRGLDDLKEHIEPKAATMEYDNLEMVLRLDSRQGQDQNIFEFDLVYGIEILNPNWVFRIL